MITSFLKKSPEYALISIQHSLFYAAQQGIPARLAGGFAIKPQEKTQSVYADQAHAWLK